MAKVILIVIPKSLNNLQEIERREKCVFVEEHEVTCPVLVVASYIASQITRLGK